MAFSCGAYALGSVAAVVGVLLSFRVFFPPPPLSTHVISWQDRGTFYSYNGHSIFYIDVKGGGSSGTVICLHGFPTFSWDWSKILPGLQSQYSRIILLDYLGFGLSDKPSSHSYSIFEQADIVTRLAQHLSVREVHLLSHDYGDTVALELLSRFNQAADDKEKNSGAVSVLGLQSLTMLNGGVFPETHHPRILQKEFFLRPIIPDLCRRYGEVFGTNKPTEEEYRDFYSAIMHNSGHHVTASLMQYIPERHKNRDRWVGALKNSRIPVLMIYGPADPVNPPQFADMFRREAGQHKLVVLDDTIGHYPQWEDPAATVQHLKEFVQQLQSDGPSD